MAGVKGRSGDKKGTPKSGGRLKGTPNKRSLDLLNGLLAVGCPPAEEIATLLHDLTMPAPLRMQMWERLLPYLYPQFKALEPDGYLTVDQAAGMLTAMSARFRQVLVRHMHDQALVAEILQEVRGGANGSGARLDAVLPG